MTILHRLFGGRSKHDDMLNMCDLAMVRDEIIDFHKIMKAEGEAEGGAYLVSKEYLAAWETFRDNPNIDNARTLLEIAPPLLSYFEGCCPGGGLYTTNSYLAKHDLKK